MNRQVRRERGGGQRDDSKNASELQYSNGVELYESAKVSPENIIEVGTSNRVAPGHPSFHALHCAEFPT